MPSWKKVVVSGSDAILNSVTASNGFFGTASWATNAVSASFVNTLNQNVLITGSLTVGAASLGASENTLTLGPRDSIQEGGQIMLQAPGGTYTSASMWDNYQNQTRLLRGSNAGSDAVVAQFNMHTKQVTFPQYNNVSSFPGTAAAFLAVDSSGNLITTSSAGSGGSTTINNNVDNYVITGTGTLNTLNGEANLQFDGSKLTVTGEITASGAIRSTANNTMYFRGGDDAEFWDINVANTVGIYGQQTQAVGGLKLGSAGATLFGSSSRFGIETITPVATLDINGNLFVATALTASVISASSGITGSLFGTSSWATNAITASFLPVGTYNITSSWATNALIASSSTIVNGRDDSLGFLVFTSTTSSGVGTTSTQVLENTGDRYIRISPSNGELRASAIGTNNIQPINTATMLPNAAGTINAVGNWSFNNIIIGTSSWAQNVVTASYVTASGVFGPYGSNSVISSSFAVSASWAPGATPTTPGGASTNIQFNSASAFGGSNNLRYSFNPANTDADQLTHQYNYDFSSTGANNFHPASFVPYNFTGTNSQKLGLSHFQILQTSGQGATTIYKWNAVPGGTGTDLQMYGFKCDYSLLLVDTDLGSGNNVASRVGTLKAAWSWSTGNTPAINDDFVDGDLVYNELGLVTFTLNWNDPWMELQMDCGSITAGNTIFQGIFTNFGTK